jgi:hypothetical protein
MAIPKAILEDVLDFANQAGSYVGVRGGLFRFLG